MTVLDPEELDDIENVEAEVEPSMADAYWRAREAADAKRESGSLADAFARAAVKPLDDAPELEPPVRLPESETAPMPVPKPPAGAGPVRQRDMAVAGSSAGPAPGGGFDWVGLKDKLEQATLQRGLDRGLSTMIANAGAVGAYRPNQHAGDELVEAAHVPLQLAQAQQAFEGNALNQRATQHKLDVADAMDNPNSLQSQKARETFLAAFPDMAGKVPGIENFSANEISNLVKLQPKKLTPLEEAYKQSLTGQADALTAQRKAESDRKAAADAAETASLVSEREALARDPRFKAMGLAWPVLEKADREGLKAIRHQMESYKPPKGGAGGGKSANIKEGDISSVPERRPGYRNMIAAIARGDLEAPKPGSKQAGQEVISDVMAFKPDFDARKFGQVKDAGTQVAHNVKIKNALTAKGHFQMALDNIPDNFDANAINRIKNAIANKTGGAGLTKFETAVAIGAGELSKGLGENAEAGKEQVRHLLDPNQSKEQLRTRLMTLVALQEEALETERRAFSSQAGADRELPEILRRDAAPHGGGAAKTTPSGKPFVKSQTSKDGKRRRFLDATGAVVEEVNLDG